MSETTFDASDSDRSDDVLDLDQAFGSDDVDAVVVEPGYSPPELPRGMTRFGTTAAEAEAGESLDQRLAQEEPDPNLVPDLGHVPADDDVDKVDDTRIDAEDLSFAEVGDDRAGRLVDPGLGFGEDREKDLVGDDVGIDAGAASAEEAAVHVIDQ